MGSDQSSVKRAQRQILVRHSLWVYWSTGIFALLSEQHFHRFHAIARDLDLLTGAARSERTDRQFCVVRVVLDEQDVLCSHSAIRGPAPV